MVADLRKSPSKIVFAHFEPKLRKRPKLQNPINPEIFDCERKYFTEFLDTLGDHNISFTTNSKGVTSTMC